MRETLNIILIVIFSFHFFACKLPEDQKDRFYTVLMDAKKASLNDWKSETSLEFVGLRTGMILGGGNHITLSNSHVTATGGFRLQYRIDKNHASEMTIGSAVPISSDGYFLTARHCVDEETDMLAALAHTKDSIGMVKAPFRIVWASHAEDDLDLALIHAELRPFRPFQFSDQESLAKGNKIGVAGWSSITKGKSNPMAGVAVGDLVSVKEIQQKELGLQYLQLRHTAPLHPGDSGGPIVDEIGNLVGINAEVRIVFSEQLRTLFKKKQNSRPARGYLAVGSLPDQQWLQSLIEADRSKKRLENTGSTLPESF